VTAPGEALIDPRWRSHWLAILFVGTALGLVAAAGYRLGVWGACADAIPKVIRLINTGVGPVWIPMAALSGRVSVLVYRAHRSRSGQGAPIGPVSPELAQLAPLATGLGFAGTVWGLMSGFGALEGSDMLAKLPLLLSGIGAAMISTLVGLALWAATLSLSAWVPVWSWARIRREDGDFRVSFDDRDLGRGAPAIEMLVEAVRGREPEALCLAFDRSISRAERERVVTAVWSQRDADLVMREVTLS
jgi:hypothetical protein